MIKYDAKMKKHVTKDWLVQFPTFQMWKPTRLLRRHGPLLIGICLEYVGDPTVYRPSVHFHNLCLPFPDISLDMTGFVLCDKQMPCKIRLKDHYSSYVDYVARIKEEYSYTCNSDIDFNVLVTATHKYLNSHYWFPGQHSPYSNLVTISAYLGHLDYAMKALDRFAAIISEWPEGCFNIIESADKWHDGILKLIKNQECLKENVDEEIMKHNLVSIKDNDLRWPENPLQLWEL